MTQFSPDPAQMSKPDLRRHFRGLRDKAASDSEAAANAVADHFLADTDIAEGSVVAGYWPMRNELDPRPLLIRLGQKGCRLALPAVVEKNAPLVFRHWTPGDDLVEGAFGTQEPMAKAGDIEPDVILLPLLAFDDNGWRLGYGGGFYDRTLSAGKGLAVGLAFAAQQTKSLPHEAHDRKLHRVVTEQGMRTFE
jgi:5-formyltetrahydrofolate cyclo-ligase